MQASLPKMIASASLSLLMVSVLTACGGGGGDVVPEQSGPQADATVQVSGNSSNAPVADPDFTPQIGIQIQNPDEQQFVENSYIEQQWIHMQTCLQVSAQEPIVKVVEGKIVPTDSSDDVLRHIDGQIQASVHVTDTDATIQIRSADFDESIGEKGAYLRSIMGRYLWLSAGMAERDYPYDCASTSDEE